MFPSTARRTVPVALFLVLGALCASASEPRVAPGLEVLLARHMDWLRGKRVGLITNRTGVARTLRSSIDILATRPEFDLTVLFSPEHGIRGEKWAGESVKDGRDVKTGLPVRSLYGATRRPSPEMLSDLDVVLYDIQDVGARGYTYISTLGLAMQAALDQGKEFIVLDRPDPMGGLLLDGPVTDKSLLSFISQYEIPWIYGMTPGELARWIYREKGMKGTLRVVPMAGWKRGMTYAETGLVWIPPSPHIPRSDSPLYHAITGAVGELGVVSEGVGTTHPFEMIGAPWISAEAFCEALRRRSLTGVLFSPIYFEPTLGKFEGQRCQGAQIHIVDPHGYSPCEIMIAIVETANRMYPDHPLFGNVAHTKAPNPVKMFDKALGSISFRAWARGGIDAGQILSAWRTEREAFEPSRRAALIYPEE